VNAQTIFQAEMGLYSEFDFRERFIYWALKLVGSRYVWGAEHIGATDCSGSVCFPLLMMGYNIRITAQQLHDNLFTKSADIFDKNNPSVVFWRTEKAIQHGEKRVEAGTIVHVTPLIGLSTVLDASWPVARIKAFSVIEEEREQTPLVRAIDMDKLDKLSRSGMWKWGVDDAIRLFREM